jgi:hypothetical protein
MAVPAGARGVSHPADVLAPYQDMVERSIRDSTDKRRYRRAVALLPALRAPYTATGDPSALPAYLADLRLRLTHCGAAAS